MGEAAAPAVKETPPAVEEAQLQEHDEGNDAEQFTIEGCTTGEGRSTKSYWRRGVGGSTFRFFFFCKTSFLFLDYRPYYLKTKNFFQPNWRSGSSFVFAF